MLFRSGWMVFDSDDGVGWCLIVMRVFDGDDGVGWCLVMMGLDGVW